MTIAERNNKLKHLITCYKCKVSGKVCDDNCPTQYDAGNMGEIIENLEVISKVLDQEPRKGHWIFKKTVFDKFGNTVECSSCHKKWKTYDEVRWRKENKFCPNCGSDNREVEK